MPGRRAWLPARRAARSGRRRGAGPRWSSMGRASPAACCSCNVWTLGETEVLLWRLQVCCLNVWTDSVKELSQVSGFPLHFLLSYTCAIIVKCEYDHVFPVSCVMEHLYTQILDTVYQLVKHQYWISTLWMRINLPSKFVNRWVCLWTMKFPEMINIVR